MTGKILRTIASGIILMWAMAAFSGDEKSILGRFTPEEQKKLIAGEAVYKHVQEKGPDGKMHGHGESYALIDASVEQSWKIFCEFDKHHLYFPRKKKSEVVKRWDNKALVYKEFDFYVTTIEYTILYTLDTKNHRLDFKLDKDYKHDIEDAAGYFLFEKLGEKRTLVTYAATKVETGVKVPGFIQEYITSRDLPAVVMNVKKRIESGGKWTKDD